MSSLNRNFDFAEEFGKIDGELIAKAGEPWAKKKGRILQLYRRKIAAAAVILLAGIAAAGNPRVQAAVRRFTTRIGEIYWFASDLKPYTEVVGKTQTQGDISLTLDEVILDTHTLIVSLQGDFGERKRSPYLWINEEKTTINGRKEQPYPAGAAGGINLEMAKEYGMDTEISLCQEFSDLDLSGKEVKVHLVIDAGKWDLENFSRDAVDGEFVYDFVFDPEEIKAQTVEKKLNLTIPGEDVGGITLTDLTMNDLSCWICVDGLTSDDELTDEYELKLKGEDSFGNPVSLFQAYTSNGTFFKTNFYGDYESGVVVDEDTFEMAVPDKDCDYLDLQLYRRKWGVYVENTEYLESEDLDEEYACGVGEIIDLSEAYADDENHGWEPVGEKFRIRVKP